VVVSLVLHVTGKVAFVVERVDNPHPLTTVVAGVAGTLNGVAVTKVGSLVQLLAVRVTV